MWFYVLSPQQSLIVLSTRNGELATRIAQDYANQTGVVVIVAEGPPPDSAPLESGQLHLIPGSDTAVAPPHGVFVRNKL